MAWDGGGKGWGKGGGKWDMMAAMMAMKGGMMGMKGGDKGWGKGKGGWDGGKMGKSWDPYAGKGPGSWGEYKIDETGGVLGEFSGKIRSFSDKNGYGFIECEDLKALGHQDVFMHGDMKKNYQKGNVVKFTAFLTGKGQLQCKDLQSGLK
eukprot:TRINITY_DN39488_c0_g1_i3.p1 TRINITY_DN39488_c0_g1~~TRINITY_DN39488_c0_g1_i3.p1  ORF type:complete len:150 (+),score=63.75 TRINITY_DN39488_c0_g1_i3:100-549(+)